MGGKSSIYPQIMMPTKDKPVELSEQYASILAEMAPEDVAIYEKHKGSFDPSRHLLNMIELGIDVSIRRQEVENSTDPDVKTYGAKIVQNLGELLGIAESRIGSIARSVEIMGGDYLRELAKNAKAEGVKLTLSHLKELNRIDSPEFAMHRQEIIGMIFDGKIIEENGEQKRVPFSTRDVAAEVDKVSGSKRRTVDIVSPAGDSQDEEDRAFAAVEGRDGDAMDELSTPSEIDKLCVMFCELMDSIDKKLDKVTTKIQAWHEDAAFETLQGMLMDSVDAAASKAQDYAQRVHDVANLCNKIMETATAANSEATVA